MNEADLVAKTVNTWLGNPISRSLLRWVSKRTEKGSKLESALNKYVGDAEKLSLQEKLAYSIVKLALVFVVMLWSALEFQNACDLLCADKTWLQTQNSFITRALYVGRKM